MDNSTRPRPFGVFAFVAGAANAVDVSALYLLTVVGRIGGAGWGIEEPQLPFLAMTSMAGTAVGGMLIAPLARRLQGRLVLVLGAAGVLLCLAASIVSGPWIWPIGFALGAVSIGVCIGGFAAANTATRTAHAVAVHAFTWLVVNAAMCVAAVWIATRHGVGAAFVAYAFAFATSAMVMWWTLRRHPLPADTRTYAGIRAGTLAVLRLPEERAGLALAAASGAAFGAFWAVAATRLPFVEVDRMDVVAAMIIAGGLSAFGWQRLLRFRRALLASATALLAVAFALPLIRSALEEVASGHLPPVWVQVTVENAALEIGAAAIVVWLGATFGPGETGLETLAAAHAVKYGAMALAGIAAGAAAAWLDANGGAIVGLGSIVLLLTTARSGRRRARRLARV